MALAEDVRRARWGLELARLPEAEQITVAVQQNQIVGVLGEAEVGKSETIRQALGHSSESLAVLRLDLDGAAGDAHLAFLLGREIVGSVLSTAERSTLKVGVLVPATIHRKRLELAELLGVDGLDEALRDWPSGHYDLSSALAALEKLAGDRETILWVDHLEAPSLTPRHPLDLNRFLWSVREIAQRLPSLGLVLSGRAAIGSALLDEKAAFHQQGSWLALDNPTREAWGQVARAMKVKEEWVTELTELTGGHPETMLLALLELLPEKRDRSPEEILRRLASASGALAARSIQHARTLHRLGGQLLLQVALGSRPYARTQRGSSPQQEITKVLWRLRAAGLIRHDEDGWSVVNPLVRMALREDLQRAHASGLNPADEDDRAG